MMARLLPQPILTLGLALVWLLLVNEVSAGSIVLGLLIGSAVPLATSRYWPEGPLPAHPLRFISYGAIVLWDIVVSNIEVAGLVLFRRADTLQSRFVTVPLDLRSAEAIAILSATITMTPGTVSADLSSDGSKLLVHCLNADDPDAVVAQIKQRYEARLKEIFE
jgi:multicomponent K+:H+ antiporter subunit E